jgi:hypothetical protein
MVLLLEISQTQPTACLEWRNKGDVDGEHIKSIELPLCICTYTNRIYSEYSRYSISANSIQSLPVLILINWKLCRTFKVVHKSCVYIFVSRHHIWSWTYSVIRMYIFPSFQMTWITRCIGLGSPPSSGYLQLAWLIFYPEPKCTWS